MAIQVSARRVVSQSASAEVFATTATASAQAVAPAVSGGGWPTAETTGATGTLTPDSSQFLGTNGATYTNIEFTDTGTITIAGDNMTFTNCKFNGKANLSTLVGCTLTDCTFAAGATGVSITSLSVSSSSNVTVTRAKIENFTDDAIHVTSDAGSMCDNVVIQDSYIYNSDPLGGAHGDGLQVRGSTGLQLLNCYIHTGPGFDDLINSAIFFEEANGGNSGFLVDGCFLQGSGWTTAYLNTGSGTVQNNTFVAAPGDTGNNGSIFYDDGLGGDRVSDGITGTGNVDELGNPLSLHPS